MNELESSLRSAEKWANSTSENLVKEIGEAEPIITFAGKGAIPALVFYWAYQILASKPTVMLEVDAATFHLLPYGEGYKLIHFASTGKDSSLVRIADAAKFTNSQLVVISPEIHKMLTQKLKHARIFEVPSNLELTVATSILALKSGYGLAVLHSKRSDERIKRLESEISDLAGVVEEVIRSYEDKVLDAYKALTSSLDLVVTYTPTMESSARYLAETAYSAFGKIIPILPISSVIDKVSGGSVIIAFTTGVEDDSVKELRYKCLTSMCKLIEFRVNTDPVTAQIYGLMLGKAVSLIKRGS